MLVPPNRPGDPLAPAYDPNGQPYGDRLPRLYKIVAADGRPVHGGSGQWSLPEGDKPGEWWSIEGTLAPCSNALHVTDAAHLGRWYDGARGEALVVFPVEVRGLVIDAGDKWAVQSARLLPPVARKGKRPDYDAANRKAGRIARAASKAYDAAVKGIPQGWRTYLEHGGSHPEYAGIIRAAQVARDAEYTRARAILGKAESAARAYDLGVTE